MRRGTEISERLILDAARGLEGITQLLIEGLDWPLPDHLEAVPLIEWTPDQLGLNPDQMGKLVSIHQVPKLTSQQPFGVFILEFDGGRLPIGALRKVLDQLVLKQRGRKTGPTSQWDLGDLIFFCHSAEGGGSVHVAAWNQTTGKPELRAISWTASPTPTRLSLLRRHTLPDLVWPSQDVQVEEWRDRWRGAFTARYRQSIRSATELSTRMAEVAIEVRTEINDLVAIEEQDGPLHQLINELRERFDASLSDESFGDIFAQTLVYGLLSARISNPEDFRAAESRMLLDFENPFLQALYARVSEQASASLDLDHLGLEDLAHTLADTDVDELLSEFGNQERGNDPVVYLYENFLATYDPAQRRQLGAYYTPMPVVACIINLIDEGLKAFCGIADGIRDEMTWGEWVNASPGRSLPQGVDTNTPVVCAIDPATGTGTFMLEWLRRTVSSRTTDGVRIALQQISAVELSLASYAVAHLKVGMEIPSDVRAQTPIPIFLGNALSGRQPNFLEGLEDPLSVEAAAAAGEVHNRRHTVVIGNPPYLRTSAGVPGLDPGGMVRFAEDGGPGLIEDFVGPLRESGGGVHAKNLYNLYVYFWRWAIWKVTEHREGPAIVGFITASSFLTGPGFLGMREMLLNEFDSVYVIDLGGEGRGSRKDENVFEGVLTPVAICICIRSESRSSVDAAVKYVRIEGERNDKFGRLGSVSLQDSSWKLATNPVKSFVPTVDSVYQEWPSLTDLFPWQQSGCKFSRTWPIAPSAEILEQRWRDLCTSDDKVRDFKESGDRKISRVYRRLFDQVQPLEIVADLTPNSQPEAIRPYGYRAFDMQLCLADGRVGDRLSGSLWHSQSPKQVFMVSLLTGKIGKGPAAVASSAVPDLHYFRGSYGAKDVVPLYRDSDLAPNMDADVQRWLNSGIGLDSPCLYEDFFAYCYGILAGTDYSQRFASELEQPGPRIPITCDPSLFRAMSEFGRDLIGLQTYGEVEGFSWPSVSGLRSKMCSWLQEPTQLPDGKKGVVYDSTNEVLRIADGVLANVTQEVWDFEVSGLLVVKKWLSYRSVGGAGRAAGSTSRLDSIRATRWTTSFSDELTRLIDTLQISIDSLEKGNYLLDRILANELLNSSLMPPIADHLRLPPAFHSNRQDHMF